MPTYTLDYILLLGAELFLILNRLILFVRYVITLFFFVFSDIYKNCWLYTQNKKNSTGQNDIAFRNIILHLVVVVARHRAFTNSAIERQCINAVVKYYKSAVFVKISFLDVFELSNMVANSDI